jgi:hypothetical protein
MVPNGCEINKTNACGVVCSISAPNCVGSACVP